MTSSSEIIYFEGEHNVFPNFYLTPIVYEGITHKSVEQTYQYGKTMHHENSTLATDIIIADSGRDVKEFSIYTF